MTKKVLIDPASYHEIVSYCEAVPVPFDLVEKAARVKKIFTEAVLADVNIKEVKEKGAPE